MAQLGGGAGFALEAIGHSLAAGEQGGGHDLDGDFAIERDFVRQEDGGHAAAPQLAGDVEFAERGAAQVVDQSRLGIDFHVGSVGGRDGNGDAGHFFRGDGLLPGGIEATAGAEAGAGGERGTAAGAGVQGRHSMGNRCVGEFTPRGGVGQRFGVGEMGRMSLLGAPLTRRGLGG